MKIQGFVEKILVEKTGSLFCCFYFCSAVESTETAILIFRTFRIKPHAATWYERHFEAQSNPQQEKQNKSSFTDSINLLYLTL
jgi:hypothetical protein